MKKYISAKWFPIKALSIGIIALALSPAANANYFLQLDGIKGESTDINHKDWIDFQSFNWGVSNSGSIGGGGSGSGKAIFSDFTWTQELDKSIIGLFSNIDQGKHIKTAVVDFQNNGDKPFVYFSMRFGDAFLTDVSILGSSGTKPEVDGAFSYSKIGFDYWTQNKDGSLGPKISADYDLAKGAGSVSALAGLFARGLAGPVITSAVPEPETYGMMLAGLGLMGWRISRNKF